MLGLCEISISHLVLLSQRMDSGECTIGQVGRTKAIISKMAREVCSLAREICGGNGIILDNHVIKAMMDLEAMHTYEGTFDINMLVSGRELTGGLAAFK